MLNTQQAVSRLIKPVHPYIDTDYPLVFAHRGDSMHAPANTMHAFRRAVELGADAIETDVHWTKDGVIVTCHDETVDATSNGSGKISDLTFAELQRLDFGYRFTRDGGQTFPYRGQGVRIPALSEVLQAFPKTRVNIDIKPKHPASLPQFIQEVYEAGAQWRVLAASFHHETLRRLRRLNRRLATSASPVEIAGACVRSWLHMPAARRLPFQALQVPISGYGLPVTTERFVRQAHTAGAQVHVWTIDDTETMNMLLQMGVDGLVSNDPATAVEVRDRYTAAFTA